MEERTHQAGDFLLIGVALVGPDGIAVACRVLAFFSFQSADKNRAARPIGQQGGERRGPSAPDEKRRGKVAVWHALVADDPHELSCFQRTQPFFEGLFGEKHLPSLLFPDRSDPLVEKGVFHGPSNGDSWIARGGIQKEQLPVSLMAAKKDGALSLFHDGLWMAGVSGMDEAGEFFFPKEFGILKAGNQKVLDRLFGKSWDLLQGELKILGQGEVALSAFTPFGVEIKE